MLDEVAVQMMTTGTHLYAWSAARAALLIEKNADIHVPGQEGVIRHWTSGADLCWNDADAC
jgi:hypothetical protein